MNKPFRNKKRAVREWKMISVRPNGTPQTTKEGFQGTRAYVFHYRQLYFAIFICQDFLLSSCIFMQKPRTKIGRQNAFPPLFCRLLHAIYMHFVFSPVTFRLPFSHVGRLLLQRSKKASCQKPKNPTRFQWTIWFGWEAN